MHILLFNSPKRLVIYILLFLVLLFPVLVWAAQDGWTEEKYEHFIIYYKNAPTGFIENVEEMSEYYYDSITDKLGFTRYVGWTWDERAKIYIYDDAEDYVNNGGHAKWSHGVASPKDKVIRTYPAAHGFFDTLLPHELCHIIFREFVGFKAQVPSWFEEGVAMSQEKGLRFGADDIVRKAVKDKTFIPVRELTIMRLSNRSKEERVQLFYAEAASLVSFILEKYGQNKFMNLCQKLKKGGPFTWALDSVYYEFKNIDDLNDKWVKYLTE